jgi:lipopolysaccharide assembly outer membrane protein LptD (OstA)
MRPRPELLLGLLLVTGCAHPTSTPAPTSSPTPAMTPTPVPLHIISNGNAGYTTLTEMKDRRTIYVVRAKSFVGDTAASRTASGNGEFDRPQITFIDHNGAKTVADAPKAVLTSADKSVIMTGGVHARSQDGNVLSCDRLRYDGTSERIHGDGHVVLRTPAGLTLVGDVLDGDARLQNVRVSKR